MSQNVPESPFGAKTKVLKKIPKLTLKSGIVFDNSVVINYLEKKGFRSVLLEHSALSSRSNTKISHRSPRK